MCGVAGIIGPVRAEDAATVVTMIALLAHRGPDGSAVSSYAGATLGHSRLSIIDLSERAAQPMLSPDGRHAIVYNGEIYNYLELRRELEDGFGFRSESDTEVLLAAWQRWGEACLDRLDGMFAFCVYDVAARSAFLARDRFGQKPLFLAPRKGRLYFASEVKALLAAGIEARPDLSVWGRYLTTASYDDTAETFFAGITQLLPGECATCSAEGRVVRRRYYRLADHYRRSSLGEIEAAAQVRELMVDACRLHMRSDVPVGVMLSGGLDSASLLASLDLAGALDSAVHCFSVDFGADLTERPWIEAAARRHGLVPRVTSFSPDLFAAVIQPMMWHQEAPIGGLMNCAFDVVMRDAAARGVHVLQAGAGPDEIFGGYRNHHNLYLGLLLRAGRHDAEARIADYARNWGVDAAAARGAAERELAQSHTAIDGTVAVRPESLAVALRGGSPLPAADVGSLGDPLRDSQLHYLQGSKIPRNTRMLDRLGMAYGMEIRLPFLDHRLVELGIGLAPDLYFSEGRSKGIVRTALRGAMDDEVRLATKRSIQAPQGRWLRGEPMVSYVEGLITSESFAARGLFDVDACRRLFTRFRGGEFDNSFFVWQWINTEEWFRIFIDSDPVAQRLPLANPIPVADVDVGL